ncbi:MAG: 3-isopropylmalate dehydratase large subunit [Anaerolineales bacterium]|nr:3-isopropylmalate dehydratase large subunit [Anaerolineales bacterium]
MGHTLAEKIIAAHVVDGGRAGASARQAAPPAEVWPGDLVEVSVDLVLANDITAPIAIQEFERLGVERVFDPERVVLVPDHFAPNKDIKSAEQCKAMRQFARSQAIRNYFEVGRMGIEHVLLPEQGLVAPGDIVIGADSHTCTYGALGALATGMGSTDIAAAMATGRTWLRVPETIRFVYTGERMPWVDGKDLILYTIGQIGVSGARYKSMEFSGPAISGLSMAGRFTMANMAIEAGGKAGLFTADQATLDYLAPRTARAVRRIAPDEDATYAQTIEIDVSAVAPQVAYPHLPENVRPAAEAGDVRIDQAVIGSCTNGRIEDLRVAAQILRGRSVHPDVRCIIIPGTQQVYMDALQEGLVAAFVEAGAVVSTPTCGPCLGGYMGVLAAGERAISTTNRNFRGRMGHPDSEVYLAGPAVAAASAIAGHIALPEEVLP